MYSKCMMVHILYRHLFLTHVIKKIGFPVYRLGYSAVQASFISWAPPSSRYDL